MTACVYSGRLTPFRKGDSYMTIIVGLICKDGVVVASDSQAGSFKGVHVKRLDYTKIYDFSFDGATVIATGAGETPFITRAIEIFEARAKGVKFNKAREVADLAESVMNEVNKRYVVDRDKELGFLKAPDTKSPSSQDERTLGFALLLGVCCGQESLIYTVYPDGVAERAERYASLGSGSAFAEYLLPRLHRYDLSLDEAVRVAVYVVEEVKKVDVHCGGPTQIVSVNCTSGVSRKDESEMKKILADVGAADQTAVEMWRLISRGPDYLKELVQKAQEKKEKVQ